MTFGTFIDPAALAIVFGGATLATILRTPARDLLRAFLALAVLPRRRFRAEALLEQIATLSRIARRHGVVALDRTVIADKDVAQAIAQVVDAAPPADISRALDEARRARIERHRTVADAWTSLAEALPAMGMVGTLVGLVAMFTRMADPRAIGGAMAIALLATLYGALAAHLLAMPIASRLRQAARAEAIERLRLVAPLVALAEREAPRTTARPTAFDTYEDGDDVAPEAEAA
ncbi:motility protein A [Sphingomonas adhaesiva]|uniref:motility protein A n=1 Tax=Sphingomonas adhaesiva TaxID=28212 RepID=UPI002FF5FCD4